MNQAHIEHANVTVRDPARTAAMLCQLFDWKVRWEGPSLGGGHTVHVGTENDYLAVYTPPKLDEGQSDASYSFAGGLNHIGILVDDLDATEDRVKAAGFKPFNHSDYEPGKRFYFHDTDGIEFEIVSYV